MGQVIRPESLCSHEWSKVLIIETLERAWVSFVCPFYYVRIQSSSPLKDVTIRCHLQGRVQGPYKTPNLLAPWSWAPCLTLRDKFLYFINYSLWYFVIVTIEWDSIFSSVLGVVPWVFAQSYNFRSFEMFDFKTDSH